MFVTDMELIVDMAFFYCQNDVSGHFSVALRAFKKVVSMVFNAEFSVRSESLFLKVFKFVESFSIRPMLVTLWGRM